MNFGTCAHGDGAHELRAVLGDTARLVLLPDHEAGDVLQEQQRHAALAGELDEVRALQRRLREQDAVVREDRDRVAEDAGEAAHERVAVQRLELVQHGAVDQPRDHLADVVRLAEVAGMTP